MSARMSDPSEVPWILDVAEAVMAYRIDRLLAEMLKHGEDITDAALWRLRRVQLDELIQGGRVLAVRQSREDARP